LDFPSGPILSRVRCIALFGLSPPTSGLKSFHCRRSPDRAILINILAKVRLQPLQQLG
jgi:hypothetical protein